MTEVTVDLVSPKVVSSRHKIPIGKVRRIVKEAGHKLPGRYRYVQYNKCFLNLNHFSQIQELQEPDIFTAHYFFAEKYVAFVSNVEIWVKKFTLVFALNLQ